MESLDINLKELKEKSVKYSQEFVGKIVSHWMRIEFNDMRYFPKELSLVIATYCKQYTLVPFDPKFLHTKLEIRNEFTVVKLRASGNYGSVARLKDSLYFNTINIIRFEFSLTQDTWQVGVLSNQSKLSDHAPSSMLNNDNKWPNAYSIRGKDQIKFGQKGWNVRKEVEWSHDFFNAIHSSYKKFTITMTCDFTDIGNKKIYFSVQNEKLKAPVLLPRPIILDNDSRNAFWYPFVAIYAANNSCTVSFE